MLYSLSHQIRHSTANALALSIVAVTTTSLPAAPPDDSSVLVIKAKRVYPVSAAPVDGGVIVIRDGRIDALGADVSIPDGAKVIELRDRHVPGAKDTDRQVRGGSS